MKLMKTNKTIHNQEYSCLIAKLCEERKRLGLTQSDVAHSLGMTQSDISKMETTERRMDVFEFKELLQTYRISENAKLKKLIIEFLGLKS